MQSPSLIAIVEPTETLIKTPHLGRVVPKFDRQGIREILCHGYRIVYLVQNDVALLLHVMPGARDLLKLRQQEPWDLGD